MTLAKTQSVTWHNIPQDWEWSRVVIIPEYDTEHPWGDEWPEDWIAAIEYLAQWDYGDAPSHLVDISNIEQSQCSRVVECAMVPFAGLYCIVADMIGGIRLYRCEEDMEIIASKL